MAESLEDVANELRARGGKIEQISIPRPEDAKTRLKFLLPLLDPQSTMKGTRVSQIPSGLSGLDGYNGTYLNRIEQLSHDTAGLTLMGIEDLVQEALNGPTRTLSRETVMKLKRERLRQESEGVLEVIDPRRKLDDIGGYQFLKDRLKEVIDSLLNPSDELVRSSIPMGILLLGPPGTGKSIIAESLAGESNISMAKLGDFRGMYVGQSERNLSRIFSLIESLHPVIVFIDEIDQTLGKRGAASGDGGVDNRIFGRFLEFMSNTEHRGRILWVGASNFPDKIDPAMKRAGRFDLILPVLLPDDESRKNIIKILLNSALRNTDKIQNGLSESDYKHISELTVDFSGAELQAIVGETIRRVIKDMFQNKQQINIDLQLFEKVLKVYKPPIERRKDYQKMELLAIQDVSFIDMLPEKYQHIRARLENTNKG
jgi:SpoVK/Ycf46/Vps4 family AAA+-type ATPase